MQFLFPLFLIALGLIAIPVIIHLFYFRRFKKVYFTNVRFLREVKEETAARTKLRNLLVLLMRILAIASLVIAFAQPFLPKDKEVKTGLKAVSLFVDNSFSMNALSRDVPLLELAKRRASEIVQAYSVEDRFQVLTNDFEGRHQRLVSREDALSLIEEIEITPAVEDLESVLARQQRVLHSSQLENNIAYLITDFQKNISNFNSFRDTTVDVVLVPLSSVQEKNINIDSCWFQAPVQMINQLNTLIIKVRNLSDENVENVRLSIAQDGQEKPVGSLSIPANSQVLDSVNIPVLKTGWHQGILKITDYPIQFDDTYYLAFNVAESVKVLVINGNGQDRYLNAAFRGINQFEINNTRSGSIDYSSFPDYDMIITNEVKTFSSGMISELSQYVDGGGNLLVFPSKSSQVSSYNSMLRNLQAHELGKPSEGSYSVSRINTEEFIFSNVFENQQANLKLPVVQFRYGLLKKAGRTEEKLLTFRDGNTFISKFKSGKGNLYLCASPLNSSVNNLSQSAEVFIPMLYKMALSTGRRKPIAYTIGKDEFIEAENVRSEGDLVYRVRGENEEFIPQQRNIGSKMVLGMENQIRKAGFYDLFLKENNSLGTLAYNYNREESLLRFLKKDELDKLDPAQFTVLSDAANADFTEIVSERSKGKILWKWCLIFALIFLLAEVLLLRFWKT